MAPGRHLACFRDRTIPPADTGGPTRWRAGPDGERRFTATKTTHAPALVGFCPEGSAIGVCALSRRCPPPETAPGWILELAHREGRPPLPLRLRFQDRVAFES